VTHLGQRLSALIDGELAGSERERVLVHMARCGSCRDEVAALRMLKQRMNALGEAAAGAGLTGRLMGLSELMGLDDARLAGLPSGETVWPPPAPPGGWPVRRPATGGPIGGGSATGGMNGTAELSHPETGHGSRDDQRASWYFLTGSLAVFLAGLGTAAFIAGGDAQARAPAPPVTPSVDVLVVPHDTLTGTAPSDWPGFPAARSGSERWRPATEATFLPLRP
jgi:hypothetical protein